MVDKFILKYDRMDNEFFFEQVEHKFIVHIGNQIYPKLLMSKIDVQFEVKHDLNKCASSTDTITILSMEVIEAK